MVVMLTSMWGGNFYVLLSLPLLCCCPLATIGVCLESSDDEFRQEDGGNTMGDMAMSAVRNLGNKVMEEKGDKDENMAPDDEMMMQ